LLCPNTPSPLAEAIPAKATPALVLAEIAVPVELVAVALIAPALKLPLESRLTIALAVSALEGETVQFSASVPAPVTGEPLTVKSDDGADRPTLVAVPGKVCPEANVMRPVLPILSPVSAGVPVPGANNRFNDPLALAVLFPTGSACQRNFWFTTVWVPPLNTDAMKFSDCELAPAAEVAFAVEGRVSGPRMVAVPFTSRVAPGAVVLTPTLAVLPVPL
jgi:hypothetical protein